MPQTDSPEEMLGAAAVARALGINRATVTRWVKDGTAVPAGRLPGRTGAYLFTAAEVDRLRGNRARAA